MNMPNVPDVFDALADNQQTLGDVTLFTIFGPKATYTHSTRVALGLL
jgi:hypothetical protein